MMVENPSRSDGLSRLAAFLPAAGARYAATRNFDHGPGNRGNVSRLSPWLRRRLVTEPEVVAAALSRNGLTGAEKFVDEVCWRTYWKGWLEHRPVMWDRYCADVADLRDAGSADLTAAITGQTGIACFDAWTRELVTTGYLHNHARMWFASIWLFTLRLPWQMGADFFLTHLLDGDPASNTLSWRWVAGLHTPGKIYLARADNIARYTDGRFAPRGLASTAHPVAGWGNPDPMPVPPDPALPDGRLGLLVTLDDLAPEVGWSPFERAYAAAILPAGHDASPLEHDDKKWEPVFVKKSCDTNNIEHDDDMMKRHHALVRAFDAGALVDVQARLDALLPGGCVMLDGAGAVESWRQTQRLDALITPYAAVGPARTAVEALRASGVPLTMHRRAWDAAAWPHCRRGFFGLKKAIPDLVTNKAR